MPVTAHAAFEKASPVLQYQDGPRPDRRKLSRRRGGQCGRQSPPIRWSSSARRRLSRTARSTRSTSCPSSPREHGIGFHTDACLGGFVLPWAEKLGYPVPPFDFRLPGVTSMSVDTHKYGYAAKGTSVVLYRGHDLRHYQYYTTTDWPGGLYFSPTFAGSRPGAFSAACWAALTSIGTSGYMDATRKILETAATIKAGIRQIPELRVLGDPLFVVAFASRHIECLQGAGLYVTKEVEF